MKLYTNIYCLLLGILLSLPALIACTRDKDIPDAPDNPNPDYKEVVFELEIADRAGQEDNPSTRSLSGDNTLNDAKVHILAFKDAGNKTDAVNTSNLTFYYSAEAKYIKVVDATSRVVRYKAALKTSATINQRFFIVANYSTPLPAIAEDATYQTVLQALKITEDDWNAAITNIPMFGGPTHPAVMLDGTSTTDVPEFLWSSTTANDKSVKMLRSMAKVTVENKNEKTPTADGYNNFELKEAYIFNRRTSGYVSHQLSDITEGTGGAYRSIAPWVPSSSVIEKAKSSKYVTTTTTSGAEKIENSIYLFENNAPASDVWSDATYVVVGGVYKGLKGGENASGVITYYLVNIPKFNLNKSGNNIGNAIAKSCGPILRNHNYIIEIGKVTGEGGRTPETANLAQFSVSVVGYEPHAIAVPIDPQYNLRLYGTQFLRYTTSAGTNLSGLTTLDVYIYSELATTVTSAGNIFSCSMDGNSLGKTFSIPAKTEKKITLTMTANTGEAYLNFSITNTTAVTYKQKFYK